MPGYYLCPKDLGGNCCPYNSECQAGGNCVAVVTPTSSTEPLITPAVEGCTTSQYKCPDGTGCCNNWQSCTRMDNTAYCADGIPPGSDAPEVNDGASKGLSDGAKAGVGVTVVASVGLVAGVAAWVWILLKRKRARAIRPSPVNACQDESAAKEQDGQAEPATIQAQDGDYFGRLTRPRNEASHSPGPERAVPRHPETPSDITTPVEIDSAVLPPEQGDFGLPSVAELPETPVELDGSPLPDEPHGRTYFWSSDDSQSE
ncbi:hypothetical protein K4F52_006296 [Lecanicillium sp. MT-2017a]|nr:hypothetical protein K4F52_006296 [Lecanicillium sp. MT-2017a]